MQLLLVALLVVWTIVLIRLLCFRATVSDRTLLNYIVLGMLIGPTAILPLHRLLNPYSAPNFPYTPIVTLFLSLLTIFVLLTPILFYLFSRRTYMLLSIADAFLLAFMVGFGFDLLGVLLATGNFDPWSSLSLLPPWQQEVIPAETFTLTGTGYRTGFVALVLAASLRLVRKRSLVVLATSLALLWVSADTVAWMWPAQQENPGATDSLRTVLTTLSFNGLFTAWLILIILMVLQFREYRWLTSSEDNESSNPLEFVDEWRELFRSLTARRFSQYLSALEFFGLRRQVNIGQRELHISPNDALLVRTVPRLEEELQKLGTQETHLAETEPAGEAIQPVSLNRWVLITLPWVAVIAMLFMPGGLSRLIALVLMAALLWWYVTSADRMEGFRSADDIVRFYGERSILLATFAVSLLVFFSILTEPFFPPVAVSFQLPPARLDLDVNLFLLLLAVAATGFTSRRRARWQLAPWRVRQRPLVRKVLTVLTAFAVAWLCIKIYTWGIPKIHEEYGIYLVFIASVDPAVDRPEDMPAWAKALRFNQPEPFGNNLPAWGMALVAAVMTSGCLWGSRRLIYLVDRILATREKKEHPPPQEVPEPDNPRGGSTW